MLLTAATAIAGFRLASRTEQQARAAVQQPEAAQAKAGGYVGAEACKACHEEEYALWQHAPHWQVTAHPKGGAPVQGCEACHGPGASHIADPTDFSKLFVFTRATPAAVMSACLSCHASGTQHMQAVESLHGKNGVACTSCHSIHRPATPNFLLAKAQPVLCYTCHVQQRAQFEMPFHHRVNEGLVQCTDCHNPHGTAQPHQLRTASSQDVVCFTCHTDKRGPFVFEHEAVKLVGCTGCHSPHGSPNPHLLKVSNVNILCLQCHTTSFANAPGAPSFHNQAAQYQACTMCHTQIHGSNFSATFFR